jgi:zinc protease
MFKFRFPFLMPSCVLIAALLLTGCVSSLPDHPDQLSFPPLEFNLPEVEKLELANGMQLYLKEDNELPLVQMTALIGSGAIDIPRQFAGFSGLFSETWRTGGTANHEPSQLEERLDLLAANLGASMGPYSCQLDLSVRSEDFDEGMSILAEMLRRPGFSAASLDLARLKAQEEVRRQNDLPGSIARRLLMASLYPDHPLGDSPTLESLGRIERGLFVEFHDRLFAPNNLMLAISGDFDRQELLRQLDKLFGDWPQKGIDNQRIPALQAVPVGSLQVVDKDIAQTTVLIGDIGLTKDNPDQYAVRVMNFILGGGGFNSRMMQEIRSNRGLAYSVYSYFQVGRRLPGPFVAGTETRNSSVVPALELMREIMEDLRSTAVAEEELRVARESLINSFVFGFDNSHSIVTQQMRLTLFDYPDDYLSGFRDRIAAVTTEDVLRVAREYLQPERQKIVLVGNASEFNEDLESFGLEILPVSMDDLP